MRDVYSRSASWWLKAVLPERWPRWMTLQGLVRCSVVLCSYVGSGLRLGRASEGSTGGSLLLPPGTHSPLLFSRTPRAYPRPDLVLMSSIVRLDSRCLNELPLPRLAFVFFLHNKTTWLPVGPTDSGRPKKNKKKKQPSTKATTFIINPWPLIPVRIWPAPKPPRTLSHFYSTIGVSPSPPFCLNSLGQIVLIPSSIMSHALCRRVGW